MSLDEYQRKRNFKSTPEPAQGGKRGRRFVVQLHHASHRHFDFRLELDGVLKSWAVPKGPSFDPKIKRLAMAVEDHPLSYAAFEGDIPKGNYGAGHVDVFDSGTWEAQGDAREGLELGDLKFVLHGDVLRGSWVLVRTRKQGSKQQWLLIKHADGYSGERDANDFVDPKTDRPISLAKRRKTWPVERAAKAKSIASSKSIRADPVAQGKREKLTDGAFEPELCRSQSTPPNGPEWLHEVKWDGYRILATVAAGKARLWSRNGIEWTAKVPELTRAVESLGLKSAQLDGEMVALEDGRDSFNALQGRLSADNKAPLAYVLFDAPYLNGYSLRDIPLIERKAALKQLLGKKEHSSLRFSEHQIGNGAQAFQQAVDAGLEGIVCKRTNSTYRGSRNGDWVKVKGRPSDEFIVVGYTEPKGSRSGVGALLLAQPRSDGLTYVGRVGTGFNDSQLAELRKRLGKMVVAKPAADIESMERRDRALAIWVKPTLVIEVFHQGIGSQGLLRQSSFKTLREDKSPDDLKEKPMKKKVAVAARPLDKLKASSKPASKRARSRKPSTGPVTITHPERIVFAPSKVTKLDVADYYRAVAEHMLPEVAHRPLSVMRCPDGVGQACFFQKHVGRGWGPHVHGVRAGEKPADDAYLCIKDAEGLLELVQMNVLEFHPWGGKSNDLNHADRIVFDLDPHSSVAWPRVVSAARDVRKQLASIGLESFLRTSGGKGFHIVVPLKPAALWSKVKAFAEAVAQSMALLRPDDYVSVAGEKNRVGKIFIDWLRNGRGATSVASYSLRARPNAGVAMPVEWSELGKIKSGDAFTIENTLQKIARRKQDPWAEIAKVRQKLRAV